MTPQDAGVTPGARLTPAARYGRVGQTHWTRGKEVAELRARRVADRLPLRAAALLALAGSLAFAAEAPGQNAIGASIANGANNTSVSVKNKSTSAGMTQVDITLPGGTTINSLNSSGATCTPSPPQNGSCSYGTPLMPPAEGFIFISRSGSDPASVSVTGHFTSGGNVTVTASPCAGGMSISPSTVPDGTQGVPYSQQFSGLGGVAPYTFSYQGVLPQGVNLSSSGLLSGTPNLGGTYGFQVIASDANACKVFQSYTWNVSDAPSGGACSGVTAEKVASTDPKMKNASKSIDAHVRSRVFFQVRIQTASTCEVKFEETEESKQSFDFGPDSSGQHTVVSPGFRFPAYFAFPKKLGVLPNTVRVTAGQQVLSATATVTSYANYAGIDTVTAEHMEGLARDYEKAFNPPAGGLPGDEVKKVEVGVLDAGGGAKPPAKPRCSWLTGSGGFKSVKPSGRDCDEPIWLKAKLGQAKSGKTPWEYEFKRELPPGKYTAVARTTNKAGVSETEFSNKLHNEQAFRVKG